MQNPVLFPLPMSPSQFLDEPLATSPLSFPLANFRLDLPWALETSEQVSPGLWLSLWVMSIKYPLYTRH